MPLVSVAFIWVWLMDADYGLLNWLLGLVGLPGIRWLQDSAVAMYSLILVSVWKCVGYNTLIILSAMQGVPGYLYEAARLDKAGQWKIITRIMLPLARPILLTLCLLTLVTTWSDYFWPFVMTTNNDVRTLSVGVSMLRIVDGGVDYPLPFLWNRWSGRCTG